MAGVYSNTRAAMIRQFKLLRPFIRRAIALGSLMAFSIATVGVPIVKPVLGPGGKDVSRPFPCMDSACGCMNADLCWESCCCHSNVEKLAWARQHGISPPAFVVVATHEEEAPRPAAAACCSTAHFSSGSCESPEKIAEQQEQDAAHNRWQFAFVPALSSRCCHGLPQLSLILSSALAAPRATTWQPDEPSSEPLCLLTATLDSSLDAPPTPPPNA